jgi:hypothetical protein
MIVYIVVHPGSLWCIVHQKEKIIENNCHRIILTILLTNGSYTMRTWKVSTCLFI